MLVAALHLNVLKTALINLKTSKKKSEFNIYLCLLKTTVEFLEFLKSVDHVSGCYLYVGYL